MPKCINCGQYTPIVAHMHRNTPDHIVTVAKSIDPLEKWKEQDDFIINVQDQPVPMICELDWYGLVNSGNEYIWNGKELMVWNKSEQEWVEPNGWVYKPSIGHAIQFERVGYRHEWVAMPRTR